MYTVNQFRIDLAGVYFRTIDKHLTPKFLQQLINIFADFYVQEFERPKPITSQHAAKAYHLFLETCAESLIAFTANMPPLCLERPPTTALLTLPRALFHELVTPEEQLTAKGQVAYAALASPFRRNKAVLQSVGLFEWQTYKPAFYVNIPEPGYFSDHYRVSWTDATDAVRNSWNRRVEKFEQARNKAEEKLVDSLTALQRTMIDTPLYRQGYNLYPNEVVNLPFEIPPDLRFRHQFLVGSSGSGKTTLLIAQLLEDFKRVERGECSVIVMDSQNELVPNISKLALFGKNQPLEGKLIYPEPKQYPIASNIFSGDFRASYDNAEFFLNSIFKNEITPQMTTVLKYAIQVLTVIPDATVSTLKELMSDTGYLKYEKFFLNVDPVVNDWMRHRLYSKDFAVTRIAIHNRLDGFLADSFYRAMFADPRDKLDFFEELKTPKVILINTADLGGILEPFGRFIIAKVEEAMLKRKNVTKKLPVFFYIDEASDYISDEPLIAKIIDKLRKQMLGLIVSIQRKPFIRSADVLDALEHVAIQAWTINTPIATIALAGASPVDVVMPWIKLEEQPRMPEAEYEAIRREMRRRYASDPVKKEPECPPTAEATQKQKPEKPKTETPKSENVKPDAKPW
jgi:hypothetical protein